jgi:hypothetical protein
MAGGVAEGKIRIINETLDKTVKKEYGKIHKKQKTEFQIAKQQATLDAIKARKENFQAKTELMNTSKQIKLDKLKMFMDKQQQRDAMNQMWADKADQYGLTKGNFKKALAMENLEMMENGDIRDANTKDILTQEQAQNRLTRATMRFKSELLSVMFFGMAVSKVFGAMTKGATEASGATEVFGVLTMLIGLPAAMAFTKVGLALLGFWDSLSPTTQTAISWIVYSIAAIGTLVATLAALGLGIGGVMKAWLIYGKVFAPLIGWFQSGAASAFLWSSVWMTILAWVSVAIVLFKGIWDVFTGWGKSALKVFEGLMWVAIAIGGIVALIFGAPAWIVALGVALLAWGVKLLAGFKPIGDFFAWLGNVIMAIVKATGGLFTGGISGMMAGWNAGMNVPKMASGGIVTRPTLAMIGESGPEAVVPLDNGGGFGGNFSPTININNPIVSSRQDINDLAKKINEILYIELRRLGVR